MSDMIACENAAISSPFVNIDSQSDLDIPIDHSKGKKELHSTSTA